MINLGAKLHSRAGRINRGNSRYLAGERTDIPGVLMRIHERTGTRSHCIHRLFMKAWHALKLLWPWWITLFVSAKGDSIPIERFQFQLLSIEQGLSQGMVIRIVQDKYGFLWFATKDGLNRYDGYGFKIYRPEPGDSTSLSDNHIYELITDKRGLLWMVFANGKVDVFNPATEVALHLMDINDSLHQTNRGFRILKERNGTVFFIDAMRYLKMEVTEDNTSRFGYRIKSTDLAEKVPGEIMHLPCFNTFISSSGELYATAGDTVCIYSDADFSRPVQVKKYHYTRFSCKRPRPDYCTPYIVNEDTAGHRLVSWGGDYLTLYDMRTGRKTDSVNLGGHSNGMGFSA